MNASADLQRGECFETSKSGGSSTPTSPSKRSRLLITLAPPTSPEDEESCTSSVYDSIHNLETDYCRDSDDYSSDTVPARRGSSEVIEFDVVTASSDDGEYLYVEDSSSGSDDFILDHLLVRKIKDDKPGKWTSSSSGTTSSTGSSNSREESDDEKDTELRPADYWTCVKCKNKQNNPLYRYCERCYQLRKNYFPPRPRRSKSRLRKKTPGGGHHHHHHHDQQTSSDTLSSSEEQEDHKGNFFGRSSPKRRRMTMIGNAVMAQSVVIATAGVQSSQSSTGTESRSEKDEEEEEDYEIANNNGSQSVQFGANDNDNNSGDSGEPNRRNVSCSANINLIIKNNCLREPTRKRTLPNNSSQLTTTEEDFDDDEEDEKAAAAELDQNEVPSLCKRPRLEVELEEEDKSTEICEGGEESQERPKNLMLLNVLRGMDSGFSSYSSGQESIPSPVDNSSVCGSQSLQSSQGIGSELGMASQQLTYSLSRDFNGVDKGSFSDSETYRRSSTKCVVNKGEANSIMRRLQEGLLFEVEKRGSNDGDRAEEVGDEHEEKVEEEENVVKGEGEKGKGESTLRATKSLMAEYEVRKEEDRLNNLCIICVTEPKDSAFVHTRSLHICCCYKCAVKVWNKNKCCPICNRKVKNVLKCYVH